MLCFWSLQKALYTKYKALTRTLLMKMETLNKGSKMALATKSDDVSLSLPW